MTTPNPAWAKEPAPRYPEPSFKGSKIEGFRYHSKEFFEKEWEYMWTKVWLLLGRADEIPETGDYKQEDIAGGAEVIAAGGQVQVLGFEDGISTTAIIQNIMANQ